LHQFLSDISERGELAARELLGHVEYLVKADLAVGIR
jgi:hypothetical protein